MKKDRIKVIAVSAVVLVLFHETVFRIAAFFYRDASGPRSGHIQQYNAGIAENAQWIFYLLVAAVWVYLYFRKHAADYKQLVAMIASITGVYAAYLGIKQFVMLLIKPESMSGGIGVNFSWILMTGVMAFLMNALYSGLLAVPFIGIGSVIRKRKETAALPAAPESQTISRTVPAVPVSAAIIHEVIMDAGLGCLAGLLLAGVIQLSALMPIVVQMLAMALPPVMALLEEFVLSVSSPFVPWMFHKWEKMYSHIVPFMLLGGLGNLAGASLAYFQSRSQKKFGLLTQIKIGIYVGAIIGLLRGFLLYAVDYLIQDVMRVVGIALGWMTAGALIILLVAAFRKISQSTTETRRLQRSAFLPDRQTTAVLSGLLVLLLLANQGIVVYDRHQSTVAERARKTDEQEKTTTKGLRLGNLAGWRTAEGDVVISGYVSNEMNILKNWMLTAELYSHDGGVVRTAMLVDGEQKFTSHDFDSFKKRGIPECLYRGANRMLPPVGTRGFMIVITDSPMSSASFTVHLQNVDYNRLAEDDLRNFKVQLEKFNKEYDQKRAGKQVAEANVLERTVDQSPYPVHLNWTWEPNLPAVSKEQLAAIRKDRIEQYKFLNIYASPYTPDPVVYGQIDPATDWLQDTPLFIHNPYLLVSESGGNFVNSLFPYCSASSIVYSNHSITVRYDDLSARKWLNEVEHLTEMPGMIRLWFPNALDAGYKFAHVDRAQSVNVAPIDNASAAHVMNAVYVPHDYYHRGRLGHNNISPNDENAKLKLVNVKARTVIFVKLWKSRPQSTSDKEDFSYVIKVEPERREVL